MTPLVSGLLVEFSDPPTLVESVIKLRAAGFTRFETYAPFPVEGLEEVMLGYSSSIPGVMLGAGLVGSLSGFALQWYAAQDYPINVGGRPVFSWPAFVPVSFELGVLTAVLTGILTFLWRAGLPRYHHPLFAASRFARASVDRFFVWVLPDDPKYSVDAVRAALSDAPATAFTEVPI